MLRSPLHLAWAGIIMGEIDKRLQELGIAIPEPAAPVANYVGWVRTGNLVFTSGQVPLKDGKFHFQGKVGGEISVEQGQEAARMCAINVISQIKAALDGNLDRVKRVVKLVAFVNGCRIHRPPEGRQRRLRPDGGGVRRQGQACPLRRRRGLAAAQCVGRGGRRVRGRVTFDMRWAPRLRKLAWLIERPIAHRGLHDARRGIVENTASAFAAAISGDYAIECDLQLSADGAGDGVPRRPPRSADHGQRAG
jgi:enamine deaminase RidA (YjgF/YER057c/UK114 family)